MKAWEEVKRTKDRGIFWTSTSEYWIEHGVRIERFHDGRVEIKNCISGGERFVVMDPEVEILFHTHGWVVGMATVCVAEFERRVDVARKRAFTIRDTEEHEAAVVNMELLIKKLDKYKMMLGKALRKS